MQASHNVSGPFVRPVTEKYRNISFILVFFFTVPFAENEHSIHADLFLKTVVGMIPISTILRNFEFIQLRFAGLCRFRGEIRNAVHFIRKHNAMPVQRCIFLQHIMEVDFCRVAFRKI